MICPTHSHRSLLPRNHRLYNADGHMLCSEKKNCTLEITVKFKYENMLIYSQTIPHITDYRVNNRKVKMNLSINFYTIGLITYLNFQVKFLHKPTYFTKILHTDTYMHTCIFTYIKEKNGCVDLLVQWFSNLSEGDLHLSYLLYVFPFLMKISGCLYHRICHIVLKCWDNIFSVLGQYLICFCFPTTWH